MDHIFRSNCSYWEAYDSKEQYNLPLWFEDRSLVCFDNVMWIHSPKTDCHVVAY